MKKFRQYIPTWLQIPELGDVKKLINRNHEVMGLGVVYGVLPKERIVLMQPLNLSENGEIRCLSAD